MSTANLDAADLAAVEVDGLIREDVMEKIWDISMVPLELTSRIGSGGAGNTRFSWTQDKLADPVIDGQVVDGSDTIGADDTATGARVNNYTEIDTKTVKVSTRARDSDTIGFQDTLVYQVVMRQRELRRDVEAVMLSNNGSQADDGDTVPGMTGGLDAWLETNTFEGVGGSAGGYNTTTGLVDPYTPGTAAALSETIFKDLVQGVFDEGGEPTATMQRSAVTRLFSEYQFSDGARVATLTRDTASGSADSGMRPTSSQTAVNVWIGDFATLEIITNRLQQPIATDVSTMFILDFGLLSQAFMTGYTVQPLSKTGLADNRQMLVDWGLRVGNEAGLGGYRDIDETAPMVA